MPRILFFHGLSGGPDSPKVDRLRAKFGEQNVLAPEFPFSKWQLLNQTSLPNLGTESERIARSAWVEFKPDVLVGASLGGSLAMQFSRERSIPMVLIAPVWNERIKTGGLTQYLSHGTHGTSGRGLAESSIPLLAPAMIPLARRMAGLRFADQVASKTVILHSPDDELFDLRENLGLLARQPLAEGIPDATFMASVMQSLAGRGYPTEGRLVKIGRDHRMNDTDALQAMIDALELLLSDERVDAARE